MVTVFDFFYCVRGFVATGVSLGDFADSAADAAASANGFAMAGAATSTWKKSVHVTAHNDIIQDSDEKPVDSFEGEFVSTGPSKSIKFKRVVPDTEDKGDCIGKPKQYYAEEAKDGQHCWEYVETSGDVSTGNKIVQCWPGEISKAKCNALKCVYLDKIEGTCWGLQ